MQADRSEFQVLANMEVSYPHPISFAAGDEVKVGRRDEVWSEWRWVTTVDGNQGWAPEAFLEMLDTDRGRARSDYTARELSTRKGEVLHASREIGGWLWCRNAIGDEGWVPAFNLKAIE